VLPLAAVAAVAGFIGMCLVGMSLPFLGTYRMGIGWGLGPRHLQRDHGGGVRLRGRLHHRCAGAHLRRQKNMAQAVKLAAYSYTPAWLAGDPHHHPALGILAISARSTASTCSTWACRA
jgi:hypothetical protein